MEKCGGYFLNQAIQVSYISKGTNCRYCALQSTQYHFSDVSTKHAQLESMGEETCKPKLRDILLNNSPVLFFKCQCHEGQRTMEKLF